MAPKQQLNPTDYSQRCMHTDKERKLQAFNVDFSENLVTGPLSSIQSTMTVVRLWTEQYGATSHEVATEEFN